MDALLQFLGKNTAPHRQCDAILFLNHLIANDLQQKIHQSSKEKVVNILIKLLSESNITEVSLDSNSVLLIKTNFGHFLHFAGTCPSAGSSVFLKDIH